MQFPLYTPDYKMKASILQYQEGMRLDGMHSQTLIKVTTSSAFCQRLVALVPSWVIDWDTALHCFYIGSLTYSGSL